MGSAELLKVCVCVCVRESATARQGRGQRSQIRKITYRRTPELRVNSVKIIATTTVYTTLKKVKKKKVERITEY